MIPKTDYALTFACYNAVDYTKQCVESFIATGTPLDRLVVIDNGSHDSTRDYLETLSLGGRIYNTDNMGCGVAWNQGALALQAEWTIVMNNDVIVSNQWVENLIGAAKRLGVLVISPAMIEGALDYDFQAFAARSSQNLANVERRGARHAVCMAIHRSAFMQAGYFRAEPKLLGFEDTLFFHALKLNGLETSISGASWIHHFGSITQTLMKQERGLKATDDLGYRHNDRLLNQTWLTRKTNKLKRISQEKKWRQTELADHGVSLHGTRDGGQFVWR
jgi:GT2 family glycosyltransferase